MTFLFLVLSSGGAVARQAVRDTWGRDGRARVVFVMMSLPEEQEEEETRREQNHFGDVLVTDINAEQQFYQHKQVGFSRPCVWKVNNSFLRGMFSVCRPSVGPGPAASWPGSPS